MFGRFALTLNYRDVRLYDDGMSGSLQFTIGRTKSGYGLI